MAIGVKQQKAASFALFTFVFLFILAMTLAVIFYVKTENANKKAAQLQEQTNELVSPSEAGRLGAIVGSKQQRKSRLATMVEYIDTMVSLVLGQVPEDTSAEVKVDMVSKQFQQALDTLGQAEIDFQTVDPNTTGLIPVVKKLTTDLENNVNEKLTIGKQLEDLHKRFDETVSESLQKEQTLLAEKEKYQNQVQQISEDYEQLKTLLQQSSEQRIQTIMGQLEQANAQITEIKQKLLKTDAERKMALGKMERLQKELVKIVPHPDNEATAFKADGKIILIDNAARTVHLDIGSDHKVYRGLTFSVYNKNLPIPKDGKGKAEIEVFNVRENTSEARITYSEKKKPIVLGDIIANLIWDEDQRNVFVVAGQFDLNDDGIVDRGAADKIKALAERWGGQVDDEISIDSDYVILGAPPRIAPRPTFETMEIDPMAMEKYEDSLRRLDNYKEIRVQAESLSIPVFNAERFLYFIGYKTRSQRPGAF